MATTATIASSPMGDESTLRGVRRSRFSFHLNTRRSRRWLLVQLVSIAVDSAADGTEPALAARHRRQLSGARPTMGQLLDNYNDRRFISGRA